MSKVQVDKVVNLSDDGAPQLTYGAELPVGYGLTGAGGLNITGVVTAASAVFSGNVTIGGTLTYEDVTNIDVVGVSTFAGRMNVNSTIEANEGINVSAGVGTFAGNVSIADKIIHTGDTNTALRFPAADTITAETGGSERLRVASDGKIGIGINDPERFLHLSSNNTVVALTDTAASSDEKTKYILSDAGILGIGKLNDAYDTATENLRIDNSGQIQLNTDGSQTASNISVGAGADLKLYHDGSDSYIRNISNTDLRIQNIGNGGIDIYNQNSYPITFTTNGNDRARINSTGQFLIGGTSSVAGWGQANRFQVQGTDWATSGVTIAKLGGNSNSPNLVFTASRGSSVGTVVQDGDSLGYLTFTGDDGTDVNSNAAKIFCQVDGTPGSNDLPGRLVFSTTADGADSATERMRVDSSGRLGIQGAATKALLDVRASGGSATMLTAVFGANEGTTAGTLSDNADKGARVGLYHYDTDEEPYSLFSSGATSGANSINFGGGTGLMNAATSLGFYTAADTTTTTGTKRLTVASGGDVSINTGDLFFSTSGKGIVLGATSNTDANTLDDYEEGSFTPTLGHSVSTTEADGHYTKIGNLCVCTLSFTVSSVSNSTHASLQSLPFTAATGRSGSAITRYSNNSEAYKIVWHVNASDTTAAPYYSNGGQAVTYTNLSATRFDLTVVYRTA